MTEGPAAEGTPALDPVARTRRSPTLRAVMMSSLLGLLGGPVGRLIPDPSQWRSGRTWLWGAVVGGVLGVGVAVFAFVFPKAEDDPRRWVKWGLGSLILGLGAGAVAGLLRKQGVGL